jgi:hypothetical protein
VILRSTLITRLVPFNQLGDLRVTVSELEVEKDLSEELEAQQAEEIGA